MYSGKTTEFMRQIMMYKTLNKKLIILTHSADNRYSNSGSISTHNREKMDATALTDLMPIIHKYEYKSALATCECKSALDPESGYPLNLCEH
jgi:thymidine kinase